MWSFVLPFVLKLGLKFEESRLFQLGTQKPDIFDRVRACSVMRRDCPSMNISTPYNKSRNVSTDRLEASQLPKRTSFKLNSDQIVRPYSHFHEKMMIGIIAQSVWWASYLSAPFFPSPSMNSSMSSGKKPINYFFFSSLLKSMQFMIILEAESMKACASINLALQGRENATPFPPSSTFPSPHSPPLNAI